RREIHCRRRWRLCPVFHPGYQHRRTPSTSPEPGHVGSDVADLPSDTGWVRVLALAAISLAAAAGSAVAAPSGRITPTAIAGIGLGSTRATYEAALHEHAFMAELPRGRRRLSFSRAEITITLGRTGRGIAVETAAPEYRTASGAHACGDAAVLFRQLRAEIAPVRSSATGTVSGYRAGRLSFTVRLGRIGAIMLATSSVGMQDLVNAPQCGSGEEG
ncbi:MAG TPA: hypothetical protein VI408_14605, partial [Gaiellaceae bacterium]